MDTSNWRPTQCLPSMEAKDWRTQLSPEARQRIVRKIMETLKKHIPSFEEKALFEIKNIARRFEEKIYTAATCQPDYLRKISVKMMTMENNKANNALPSNSACNGENPPDPASHSIQSQVHEQGKSLTIPLANQSEALQKLLSLDIQNNNASAGLQCSTSLPSTMPPVTGLTQSCMPNGVGQNPNLQNISGSLQNSVGNSEEQGVPSNIISDPRMLVQGRQTSQQVFSQQHQLQSQNQQQQKQNLLQPSQLQSSQQSVMQTSSVMRPPVTQLSPLSDIPPKQLTSVQLSTQSVPRQHSQSVLRQQQQPQKASVIHQERTPMVQQPILPSQQQQKLMGPQTNATNIKQNQLIGKQASEMQQQQVLDQQNNHSNAHQQQLGQKSNVSGLQQQQQLLGAQSGNSSKQSNQCSIHMLQQPEVAVQQKTQQAASSSLPFQGQRSQPQHPQQQLKSQSHSQPAKLQQQLNPLQQDMQQRLQTSALDSTSEKGHANVNDWQQEAYQKIKSMRDMYLPELNEIYKKIAVKLQQYGSLPHQPKTDPYEKFKDIKFALERIIRFLHVSKSTILPAYLERLDDREMQIISIINSSRTRKTVSSLQQGQQLPMPDTRSLQHSLQPPSQTQVKPHEDQMNPHSHPMNLQSSVTTLQHNSVKSLQHDSLSSLSEVTTAQQNMTNSQQPGTNLDPEQGNAVKSLQQVAMGSLQIPVSAPQHPNNNTLLSPSNVNVPQPNVKPFQSNYKVLQHINLKQPKEQQMIKTQQLKQQFQQRRMQQQQSTQSQGHEIPERQMDEVNDFKVRQGNGVKSQYHSADKSLVYHHQQLKPGASYSNSSPQILRAASPQNPQISSPQTDQQNLLTSLTKSGIPLQSANSPSVVPSPSTPLAPSSFLGDSGKIISGVSSLSNARSIGCQQTTGALAPEASLVISTPGMSASPLLVESNNPGGNLGDVSTIIIGKSSVTEQPLERLINLVKSLSPKALNASVSDIASVVSLFNIIAGSAPGNGSRASVGEDLGAMILCRLQPRNFTKQGGSTGTRKMKRYASALPLKIVSLAGSIDDRLKQLTDSEAPNLESNATSSSRIKRPRIEANYALVKEIKEINQRLIDTVVVISDQDVDTTSAAAATEGSEGTIVKCSFSALAVSPNLKSQHASVQMSPILPLRLLVPTNYPNCSPIFLDKFSVEISKESEDLSVKTKSKLSISLQSILQPISLWEIARTWDICAREVISEYAQQSGGGNFSSIYGTWENCLGAT